MTDSEFDVSISRIKSGNRDGLKHIYDAYVKLIYAVMFDVIKQREDAEDLTADFFVRLYKLADSYKPGNGHKKWLITIARNMAVDKIRKLDREILTENFTDLNEAGNTFSDEIVEAMTLGEAMKKLNYGEKEIVDLKIAGELTFREIAELTGRPVGTVAWVYNNAIGKLRRCKVWK